MIKGLFIIILFFAFLSTRSFAQFHVFDEYTLEQGMPENTGNVLFEDKDGFIWIGTQAGVTRFDGLTFKTYGNIGSEGKVLTNNMVESIYQDSDGIMWIGTRKGLNRLDAETDSITQIYIDGAIEGGDNFIRYGMYDDGNFVWFCTNRNLYSIDKTSMSVEQHSDNTSPKGSSLFYSGGTLYFSYGEVLFTYREKKLVKHSTLDYPISRIQEVDQEIILATTQGAYHADGSRFKRKGLDDAYLLFLARDKMNKLWIGTKDGLFVNDKGKLFDLSNNFPVSSCFGGIQLDFLEDTNDNIWIGTSNGVICFKPNTQNIRSFTRNNSNLQLPSNQITSLAHDKQTKSLAIGTNNGLLLIKEGEKDAFDFDSQHEILESKRINYVKYVERGELWIGTESGEIYQYKNSILKKVDLTKISKSTARGFIKSVNTIIVARANGLITIDSESLIAEHPKWLHPITYTVGIYEKDDNILVAHSEFLYELDLVNRKQKKIVDHELPSPMVTHLQSSKDQKYKLYSTISGGAFSMHSSGEISKHYLPGKNVWFMGEGKQNRYWLVTDYGIYVYRDSIYAHITEADGLLYRDLKMNSNAMLSNGWLVVGSEKGVNAINTKDYKVPEWNSNIQITNLHINGNQASRNLIKNNELHLYPSDKSVTFQFAAPTYTNAHLVDYTAHLSGFDQHPRHYKANEKLVYYNTFLPGRYLLSITAKNDNGLALQKKTIWLVVHPRYYQTWWFIVLMLFLVIGIIYVTIRFRERKKRKKLEDKLMLSQSLENERKRISRDLHDTIGSGLTKITTDLDIMELKYKRSEGDDLAEALNATRNYAQKTIMSLRETIWTLDGKPITLRNLKHQTLQFLSDYFSSNIQFRVQIAQQDENIVLTPIEAINLLKITQEMAQNVLKHSRADFFEIIMENTPAYLTLTFVDNGIGYDSMNTEGLGEGIANIKKRCLEISATFTNLSTDKGTKCRIVLANRKTVFDE
ncbi:MAG: histidine kinase [Flavobacteriales bacterium]|nr:histidine kinase [Flavobacteriales bacterium]